MEEKFTSWVVVHQKVEVAMGLETGMKVDCMRVMTHTNEVFPLTELGYQRFIVLHRCFGNSF